MTWNHLDSLVAVAIGHLATEVHVRPHPLSWRILLDSVTRTYYSGASYVFLVNVVLPLLYTCLFIYHKHRSSATQDVSCILCNPKVYYRVHKRPLPLPILRQIDPVHASLPTYRKSILILSFRLRLGLPNCLLFFQVFHQKLTCTSTLPHTCYMPYSFQFSWFNHPNDIWWGVQSIKLLSM